MKSVTTTFASVVLTLDAQGLRALIVAGVAAIALTGCGDASEVATTRTSSLAASPTDGTPKPASGQTRESNQRILTRAESLALVHWAEKFRTCMQRDHVEMAALRAEPRQILLATRRHWSRDELAHRSIRCGDGLGGPPTGSSLQVAGKGLVLYLPIQCLLDGKVLREHS